MHHSDPGHPQPRTESYPKVWRPSRFLLRPTSGSKWPAVVQSLMLCILSASQNRLEIKRQGEKSEGILPSLPFHSIEYAPEQTDIWVTLHSLKRAKWIPDPFLRTPPTFAPSPSLTNCTLECQTSSLSHKYTVCQLMGHWLGDAG